jgi:hypothetical protein
MTTRTTLPTASQIAALAVARPLTTGNLLADCERWCREHFPHRWSSTSPRRAPAVFATRGVPVGTAPVGS